MLSKRFNAMQALPIISKATKTLQKQTNKTNFVCTLCSNTCGKST